METVKSKRDKDKLVHEGYVYVFDKFSRDTSKKFWRCEQKKDCKARIHTAVDEDRVLQLMNQHSHGSDASQIGADKIVQGIKRRATETAENPSVLLNCALKDTTPAVLAKMPKKDAVRKLIQRRRNKTLQFPSQPTDRASLIIPEAYQMYTWQPGVEERFLLWDSGDIEQDDNRILIFGRFSHATWCDRMERLFVDGTFSLAPAIFSQVYVIMAEREGFVLPVLYALLPNKQEETYKRMLQAIKEMWPELNPVSVSMDFEQAAIGAFRSTFSEVHLHGCLFHLTRNMRNKLADEGLLRRYNTDSEFAVTARMIVALAFVPIADLDAAFTTLSNHISQEFKPILDWFEVFYIGRPIRNRGRRRAMFPPDMWSVYDRTVNGLDRTNNYAEAAHRRMQAEFGVDHPNIWKFIDGLRVIQKGRDQIYEQFVRREQPATKRRKYVAADARISTIVQSYAQRNVIEYLRGLSHNFLMD
jgi:hypothetical protein